MRTPEQVSKNKEDSAPVVDFADLPKFTPELIAAINNQEYEGGQILIPPHAYPEMNLESDESLMRIREGVSAMFSGVGLQVDKLVRARKDEKFIGLVFTLQATPAK